MNDFAKDTNVPINGCISRQAAIDTLAISKEFLLRVLDDMDIVGQDREKYSWGLGLIEACINDMRELPSAQPERKKGKWIWLSSTYDRIPCEMRFWCSECHHETIVHTSGTSDPWEHYCPNCGADMRGDGDADK